MTLFPGLPPGPWLTTHGLTKSFPLHKGPRTVQKKIANLPWLRTMVPVFENLDFTLEKGECVALVGPNGSGKSTFLRCLAGVMQPSAGRISQNGKMAAILTHGFGNYDELPVWKNLLLAMQLFGKPEKAALDCLEDAAKVAGLYERMKSPASQLSEGMRAKIPLAALVFADFDLALLDESLNHVDADFRQYYFEISRRWLAGGRSLILTSHDEQLPQKFATRTMAFAGKPVQRA